MPFSVSNTLVTVDKVMDFIPFLSTLNNLVDLLAKGVLKVLGEKFSESRKENAYVAHLLEKDSSACIMLAIPFLNIFAATMLHAQDFVLGVMRSLH